MPPNGSRMEKMEPGGEPTDFAITEMESPAV
jgi:hypothetical protein